MFDEVKTDKTRALFEDYPVLLYGIAGQRVRDGDLEEDPTGYGFAVDEGQNPELLEKFNTGLSNFKASG
ncbi:MAG TPA: glutamine ABC transporter permease, partial [Mycobacterium sp.]|nr:glutamine ABC transporter permease [Mycobacterium sp.]